jgi:hypothetical protein
MTAQDKKELTTIQLERKYVEALKEIVKKSTSRNMRAYIEEHITDKAKKLGIEI